MELSIKAETDKLFNQLKWVDENTLQGQKKPTKYSPELIYGYQTVYGKKFIYRNIPFDFGVAVWRHNGAKTMRAVRSDFDGFKGAFYFAMQLRRKMTDKETWLRYKCYEYLPGKENGQSTLKEMARAKLEKTIKEIDWYLDKAIFDLPRESFRFIQELRKLKTPMPDERHRLMQIRRFERNVFKAWNRDKSKKGDVSVKLSYRDIPFRVSLFKDEDDKTIEDDRSVQVLASVPRDEIDTIPGLRFGLEFYERIYGDIRDEITLSKNVPLQEKITYGVYHMTRFIDWFRSCPDGDILSETATILAEMNQVVKRIPARLECSKM